MPWTGRLWRPVVIRGREAATADRYSLDVLLRNEADMAAKRRVQVVLEYLDIRPGERVLDCGCGLGWFLKIIDCLYDCRLTGIDLDMNRLRSAQAALDRTVRLSASDCLRLPFAGATFDKIVLSEVLEHLADDLGCLREVERVLKPGGVVAITVPHHNYPLFWDPVNWTRERIGLDPIRSGFFGGLWTNHERLYLRDEIVGLIERAGLAVEDVRQFVHYCFPFSHNLVYGLGKWLVESGTLRSADRFQFERNSGSLLNPLNFGRWVFNRIDNLNDPVSDDGKSTVILSVKARKV